MDSKDLKNKLQSAYEEDNKLSAIAIITVVAIGIEVIMFLAKNCDLFSGLIKRSATKKGFLYKKFLKNNVYPKLNQTNLSDEEKEIAIEKIRQMIINDELKDYIN